MNSRISKITFGTILSISLFAGLASTTTPANATHQIGHAILGGIIGGVIGNAIVNNRRPTYQQRPVYQQRPIYSGRAVTTCYWQDQVSYDNWGNRRISKVQVCS